MKPTLLIMAAGMGSRFGGIKQLAPIGPNGEIIMDYSIHDAIRAGFGRIVFILRKEIEDDFERIIGSRIRPVLKAAGVESATVLQSLTDIPAPFPAGRVKPWGTAHAVISAKDYLDTPFGVINSDDYYGSDIYRAMADHLQSASGTDFCMAGFALENTLSESGGVTRGLCRVENGYLTSIKETHNIIRTAAGAEADGTPVDPASRVSMNMWGLTPAYLPMLEEGFEQFFREMKDPMKDEYLLPVSIGQLLERGLISVKVLNTNDQWYGVTYKEDIPSVVNAMRDLTENGRYRADLYSDLF